MDYEGFTQILKRFKQMCADNKLSLFLISQSHRNAKFYSHFCHPEGRVISVSSSAKIENIVYESLVQFQIDKQKIKILLNLL
ncbi:hypothetical protein GCM10011518_10900 [Flavobacterium limi]|uniref:Uncharacterized protein n=1 Tax=Flavobacterium limi TaxID=2045105 RepID=A0ABQ1TW93_9FLAO|nr:hypothetical protein GCM10011518_10900 [Flavobacterium limi]